MGEVIKFPEQTDNLVEVEMEIFDRGQVKDVLQTLKQTITNLNGNENVPGVKELMVLLKKTYRDLSQ